MDSIHIILECPSKNKRYNIEITNEVTPYNLEQEFKEQFFNNDQNLKFYYNDQLLDHNKSFMSQNVVKGSIIIIRLCFPVTLMIPSNNKSYLIEINELWTLEDISLKISNLLQLTTEQITFQVGTQTLKMGTLLIDQQVIPKCTIIVNIQQQGGEQR